MGFFAVKKCFRFEAQRKLFSRYLPRHYFFQQKQVFKAESGSEYFFLPMSERQNFFSPSNLLSEHLFPKKKKHSPSSLMYVPLYHKDIAK